MDRLVIPGPPRPKQRPRVARGHAFTPKATLDEENRIRVIAKLAGIQQRTGPVALRCVFYMPTRRQTDLDNLAKLVQDALNPRTRGKNPKKWDPWGAWLDDSQVVHLEARKSYDKDNPRTVIEIDDAGA